MTMAEENQSAFKVTDRRLFNADGSLRDDAEIVEKPAPEPLPSTASTPANFAAPPPPAAPGVAPARESQDAPVTDLDEGAEEGMPEQTLFNEFLMNIASSAFIYMGMVEHPATGRRQVDLPAAQESIEMLLMLREKTKGNLTPGEESFFLGLLSDLQMQFVALRQRAGAQPPPSPLGGSPFGR